MSLHPIYNTRTYQGEAHSAYLTLCKNEANNVVINGTMFRKTDVTSLSNLGENSISINGIPVFAIANKRNVLLAIDSAANVSISCIEYPPALHLTYKMIANFQHISSGCFKK